LTDDGRLSIPKGGAFSKKGFLIKREEEGRSTYTNSPDPGTCRKYRQREVCRVIWKEGKKISSSAGGNGLLSLFFGLKSRPPDPRKRSEDREIMCGRKRIAMLLTAQGRCLARKKDRKHVGGTGSKLEKQGDERPSLYPGLRTRSQGNEDAPKGILTTTD